MSSKRQGIKALNPAIGFRWRWTSSLTDWVEQVADSKSRLDYRKQVTDAESASMWQSLSFGANYKAAYCLSVCPAGEDVVGPYLADKTTHLQENVKPLQAKKETVYVLMKGSPRLLIAFGRCFPS